MYASVWHAFLHALWIGGIIALLFSCLSIWSSTLRRIEQVGLDLGAQIRAQTHMWTNAPSRPDYVVLDATDSLCSRGDEDDRSYGRPNCPPPPGYSIDLLLMILDSLEMSAREGQGPAAVILDLTLPPGAFSRPPGNDVPTDAREDARKLREAVARLNFPLIVDAQATTRGDLAMFDVPGWADLDLEMPVYRASYHLLTDGRLADGVVRRAPVVSSAEGTEGEPDRGTGQSLLRFPDAALLAALFLDAAKQAKATGSFWDSPTTNQTRAAIARMFPISVPPKQIPANTTCDYEGLQACQIEKKLPSARELAASRSASEEGGTTMDFLLPPLLRHPQLPSHSANNDAVRHGGLHIYADLSRLPRIKGVPRIPYGLVKNSVVIVGSSAPYYGDWHLTPLGQMMGAEALANEVHHISTHSVSNFFNENENIITELYFFIKIITKFYTKLFQYVIPAAIGISVYALLTSGKSRLINSVRLKSRSNGREAGRYLMFIMTIDALLSTSFTIFLVYLICFPFIMAYGRPIDVTFPIIIVVIETLTHSLPPPQFRGFNRTRSATDIVIRVDGARISTGEIYPILKRFEEVGEAVLIAQDWKEDSRIVLFVRLLEGLILDRQLVGRIQHEIRQSLSPRHVPSKILQVAEIPHTRSGDVAVHAVADVVHHRPVVIREPLENPQALDLYKDLPELRA